MSSNAKEKNIPKYLHIFQYIASQIKNGVGKLTEENKQGVRINAKLDGLKQNFKSMSTEITKISKNTVPRFSIQASTKPTTFAEAARSITNSNESSQIDQTKTIIIKPISNSSQISRVIMDTKVKKIINESKIKAKIINIKTNKSSVVIESVDESNENIENLCQKKSTTIRNLTTKLFKLKSKKKKRDQTIVLKGVVIDNNITKLVSKIIDNNESTIHGPSTPSRSGDIQNKTSQMKNHIFIDFQMYRVEYKAFVKQCQRCYLFNHKTLECELLKTCRDCSEEKTTNHCCINNYNKVCINCKNNKIYKKKIPNHAPNTEACSIYYFHVKRIIDQTNFGD
ncbi:hypothetical protein SSS_01016 [Sarcoptes scabiei]|uniref:Uncharacterized protein n=1 Tax=Sarcoptes scabiei TaxID=52283 RepID=A0A834RDT9_SARSC|nr:hypothetical protein SSS_01016 [Sarcoptes scabiei]